MPILINGSSGLTTNDGSVFTNTSGNVGIGTSSPASKLEVSGSGTLELARFATTTDNTPSIGIYSNGAIRARLRASTAETALLSQGALPLLLGTNNTERMRITSAGNVGIGTSSQAATVRLALNNTNGLQQLGFNQGNDCNINIRAVAGKNSSITFTEQTIADKWVIGTVAGEGSLRFATGAGFDNATERMRITNAGNVGIGTSSPNQTLVVKTADGGGIAYENAAGKQWRWAVGANSEFALTESGISERMRIDSSGNVMWNGTNTSTGNGNVGHIYKFFGGANNIILPFESTGTEKNGILEYRRAGRSVARTSQISLGENASNQGEVRVFSSAANGDLTGGVQLVNGATSWAGLSDIRLKTVTGTYTNALQNIAEIEPIKFTWIYDESNTPQVGVSAQSVEAVVPEAVCRTRNIADANDETEYLSVRYTELIPLMIASIQELKAINDAQAQTIESLKARLDAANI